LLLWCGGAARWCGESAAVYLRSHHDAEDVFQATFLVLVKKAATLPNRETVGNWLYGVAHQTAVRMRAIVAKRGVWEKQVEVMPEPTTAEQYVWNDLAPVVDEELSCLPDKYRGLQPVKLPPLILHRSNAAAAAPRSLRASKKRLIVQGPGDDSLLT
jgi:hypothetical protein